MLRPELQPLWLAPKTVNAKLNTLTFVAGVCQCRNVGQTEPVCWLQD